MTRVTPMFDGHKAAVHLTWKPRSVNVWSQFRSTALRFLFRMLSPSKIPLSLLVFVFVAGAQPLLGQSASSRPLFTDFPSQLICADSSFVALSSGNSPSELVIIRIRRTGIEEPRKIPLAYHDLYGMKCNRHRVELLVRAAGADNFSRLPFTIGDNAIHREDPIPIAYAISENGPMPVEIEDFHKIQLLPMGNFRVEVPAVARFNVMYELHFIRTRRRTAEGLTTSLSVDLLEERLNGKVNKTVPLVRYVHVEDRE